jgi:predicted RNA binding protein YcfA (HicA-like mRNA interferase family)
MGSYRPIKTSCWIKFLEFHGLVQKNVVGSHFKYSKKGLKRPIPVWASEKEIPAFHVRKGCETLDVTIEEFYKWMEENKC